MIRRCSALIDQPFSMNRAARWSRSSGCVGGSLLMPKSPGVATKGVPRWCIQTRLTRARAVSGLSGLAMARASSSRPLPSTNGFRSTPLNTARNRRGTGSPRLLGLPRTEDTRLDRRGCVFQAHDPRRRRRHWSATVARRYATLGIWLARDGRATAPGRRKDPTARWLGYPGRGTPGATTPRPVLAAARASVRRACAARGVLPDLLDAVQQPRVDPRRLGQRSGRLVGQGSGDHRIDGT